MAEDIKAIDILNHPSYCIPELAEKMFEAEEFQIMMQTTFKGVGSKEALVRMFTRGSVEAVIAEMDEAGYDKIVITDTKMWSFRKHMRLIMDMGIDLVHELVEKSKGRFIGSASYNPFRIEQSLREVEKGVKEYGFKMVWFHPITFGIAPNDKKNYPLYAKCLELGIPVVFQVGHSAEVLPSEVGHPMYADEVAIDFPNLKMVLSHTGYPWIDEWCSMLWRHPNVYGDISAYFPSSLDPKLVQFMDRQGRDKVIFGTDGFGLKRCKQEFMALPVKDETKRKVLRENALKVLGLES